MESNRNIFEVNHLRVTYHSEEGDIQLIRELSFTVKAGSITAITGPSGSGKSLTALSLCGLLHSVDNISFSGNILWRQREVSEIKPKDWENIRGKQISIVFQQAESALNPLITCGKQIAETIVKHQKISLKQAEQKVFDLLLKVGLKDLPRYFHAYPHQLSGGQIQRVAIAIAIANNPDVIIADEITSALDKETAHDIMTILKELHINSGITLILISHDVSQILKLADQVLILKNGKKTDDFTNNAHWKEKVSPFARQYLTTKLQRYRHDEHLESGSNSIQLSANGLTKKYSIQKWLGLRKINQQIVLNNVTFHLKKGENLGILGESGSGKTTLAKIICGITDASEGTLFFEQDMVNRQYFKSNKKARRNIQLVLQDALSSFNPHQKVRDVLSEVLFYYHLAGNKKESEMMVDHMLETLNLPSDVKAKFPIQLSGGQRQRVALARALFLKPEIIVFDESFSSLDVENQQNVLLLILNLQRELGFSCIFISHDPDVIRFVCDNVMVLKNGNIAFYGTFYHFAQSMYSSE